MLEDAFGVAMFCFISAVLWARIGDYDDPIMPMVFLTIAFACTIVTGAIVYKAWSEMPLILLCISVGLELWLGIVCAWKTSDRPIRLDRG